MISPFLQLFCKTTGGNSSTSSPQEVTKPTKAFTFRRADGNGLFGGAGHDAGANTLGLDRDYTIIREKFMTDCDRIPGQCFYLILANKKSLSAPFHMKIDYKFLNVSV